MRCGTVDLNEGRRMTPLQVVASAITISSLGGIAALLVSKQPLTTRAVTAAALYSAVMGAIVAMLWMNKYGLQGDPWFLIGVSGLAGIGGVNVIDLVMIVAKKSGIKLTFAPKEESDKP